MKIQSLKSIFMAAFLFNLIGCTTNYPSTIGGIGGAATGAGVGAIVAHNSSSVSNLQGIGYGALIGIPVGILVAHVSDEVGRYYILTSNNEIIRSNYRTIINNQQFIDEERTQVMLERPRGNPDPDLAEYIYVGPSLGNVWR